MNQRFKPPLFIFYHFSSTISLLPLLFISFLSVEFISSSTKLFSTSSYTTISLFLHYLTSLWLLGILLFWAWSSFYCLLLSFTFLFFPTLFVKLFGIVEPYIWVIFDCRGYKDFDLGWVIYKSWVGVFLVIRL